LKNVGLGEKVENRQVDKVFKRSKTQILGAPKPLIVPENGISDNLKRPKM
jgi:hypothetical protein